MVKGRSLCHILGSFRNSRCSCLVEDALICNLSKLLNNLAGANTGGAEDCRRPPEDLEHKLPDQTTKAYALQPEQDILLGILVLGVAVSLIIVTLILVALLVVLKVSSVNIDLGSTPRGRVGIVVVNHSNLDKVEDMLNHITLPHIAQDPTTTLDTADFCMTYKAAAAALPSGAHLPISASSLEPYNWYRGSE